LKYWERYGKNASWLDKVLIAGIFARGASFWPTFLGKPLRMKLI
jgi:hypothetical protein